MPTRRTFKVTGGAASKLLNLTCTSSDVFPPLKSVAADALRVAKLVVGFRTSKDEWKEFQAYVQDAVATVIDAQSQIDPTQHQTIENLTKLQQSLSDVIKSIEEKQRQGIFDRFMHFMEYPDLIAEMTQKLNSVIDQFTVLFLNPVTSLEYLHAFCARVATDRSSDLPPLHPRVDSLNRLQYVRGASWDPHRVCLSDTRRGLIDTIISWINSPSNTNLLLLTGVAGSGKSTVAHSIAQRCAANNQLVTSFFFDRETNDRNNPSQLITTIAADLARLDARIRTRICAVIEADRGLPYAPISRQFEELVLQQTQNLPIEHTLVVILDALDEGCNDDLLRILCSDVSRLPSWLRLVLTSRMYHELGDLPLKPHVRLIELDIDGQENMGDIAIFIPYRLKQVAERHELEDDWPGEQLALLFEARAGGLFLWVATICDFLCTRTDPTAELQKLLSISSLNTSAEAKMDRLYTTILQACDWTDEEFAEGYQRLVGAVVATKVPLTISALSKLFDRTSLVGNLLLRQLSPLLTGLSKTEHTSRPARFLHQSLRDFLTLRATQSEESRIFAIDEKAHSRTLADLCLQCLNKDLNSSLPDAGFLTKSNSQSHGIPSPLGEISEAMWYACRFWIDHLTDVDPTSSGPIFGLLCKFLEEKFTYWIGIKTVHGKYESISSLVKWMEEWSNQPAHLTSGLKFANGQEVTCTGLVAPLIFSDRPEEALLASQDSVEIARQLCTPNDDEPSVFLSASLSTLSICWRLLEKHDEALTAANEALELYRRIEASNPQKFSEMFVMVLNNITMCFSGQGRHKEALEITQEAMKIRRRLAAENPAKYTSGLASDLESLSNELNNMGHYNEALAFIQEAVEVSRKFLVDHPWESKGTLARILRTCSFCHFNLEQYEEGVVVSKEAVEIFRQRTIEHPGILPDVATALEPLFMNLESLHRNEEAVAVSQEAVDIFRRLVTDRPAVYNFELVSSLYNLSTALLGIGRHDEALAIAQEAATILQEVPDVDSQQCSISQSLTRFLNGLIQLGRYEEALPIAEATVEIDRRLSDHQPAVYSSFLAESLRNFAIIFSDTSRFEEAVERQSEALDIYRRLEAERPGIFTPKFIQSLLNLSNDLRSLGRHEQALVASQESVDISRKYVSDRPDVFRSLRMLAQSLMSLSISLSGLDLHQEALSVAEEATELVRSLAIKEPDDNQDLLEESLSVLAKSLSATGAEKKAQAVQDELEALTSAGNSDSN
ncbi:hypothetical protein CTheo_5096 [Ceratobasidium theobromae]|uniref:Nephrocystin 3-like N-terminal domain-containing protein n=1 Tax=Ceratobasidium theobromae TaxID=1582974 RepID=A0A5N5QJ06_9AGAM|nr:hypothetical protein CTheo_5096 [Ceratobasidium theobromae]